MTLKLNIMKTSLKTLIATTITAIVLATTVQTSFAIEKIQMVGSATANPDIKKVIVSGNTRVILVQSYKEYVAMEDEMIEKVSVKQVGNALKISSSEKSPVTVTVYVRNPFRIDVSGTAVVSTQGKFSVKDLQILMKDDAKARIKAQTESLYTAVDNQASLELLGSTGTHIMRYEGMGKVKMDKFAALKTSRELSDKDVTASNTAVTVTENVAIASQRATRK